MRPHTITYPPDGVEPIGVIEFVHGMCETRNRYATPMEYFSRHGYICAIADMRGHGENILTTDDLGYFGEEGYKGLVNDVQEYTMYLKREFPNLPFILLGHSMGSLVVRTYLKKYSQEVDAVYLAVLLLKTHWLLPVSFWPSFLHFLEAGIIEALLLKIWLTVHLRNLSLKKVSLTHGFLPTSLLLRNITRIHYVVFLSH